MGVCRIGRRSGGGSKVATGTVTGVSSAIRVSGIGFRPDEILIVKARDPGNYGTTYVLCGYYGSEYKTVNGLMQEKAWVVSDDGFDFDPSQSLVSGAIYSWVAFQSK